MSKASPVKLYGPSEWIWDLKYRYKKTDNCVEDTWRRIARDLAQAETSDRDKWEEEFYKAMEGFHFIPAGRIIAGAGTGRSVTYFNCFVMDTIPDSIEGIFQTLKESAQTLQQGGGIGMAFSTLRPKGAYVLGVDADASGPLSFMDCWDSMCRTMLAAGSRRGAMMATLRCDHPDIEAFIEAKREPGRLRMFNMSVLCTDEFMRAVRDDSSWDLVFGGKVYKTVSARELWNKIMQSTYDYAEPGVIFITQVNEMNNLYYCENISATNPCVVAGTLVSTPGGLIPVEEIKVGDSICTVLKRAGKVDEIQVVRNQPVFKVTFSSGQSLRVTEGHIFHSRPSESAYSKNKNWNSSRVKAKAASAAWSIGRRLSLLKVGDKVRLAPGITPDNMLESPFSGTQRDYGLLMGIILGDGTYTEANRYIKISVGTLEEDWIETLRGILRRMGEKGTLKLSNNEDRGNSSSLQLSQEFADIIRGTMLEPSKSPSKSIPLQFINSNGEFLWGLLDGLVSTDGAVDKHTLGGVIKFTTTSHRLALDTQRVCHLLGMNARIYPSDRVGSVSYIEGNVVIGQRDLYEVCLIGEHFHTFAKQSFLSHPRKQFTMMEWIKRWTPQGDSWESEITAIEPDGVEDVYDLHEPTTDTWITEGVVSRGCAEQPLPPYGACLLGSMNLTKYVEYPFSDASYIDLPRLAKYVYTAVRMLDNVIEVSNIPLERQCIEAFNKRRIGLGVTGLADALIMMGVRYGSDKAVHITRDVLRIIRNSAYLQSACLSQEKGPFPLYDRNKYLEGEFVKKLPSGVREKISVSGIRNSHLTSIAPTGTISFLANNVSGGIEPVYSFKHMRKVLENDGSFREEELTNYSYRLFREKFGEGRPLPDTFVDAQTLSPYDHLVMLAAAQEYVDSSVSKTVNLPTSISFEDFKNVYTDAFGMGCKSCTTYRPNDIVGSVLTAISDTPNASNTPNGLEEEEVKLYIDGAEIAIETPEVQVEDLLISNQLSAVVPTELEELGVDGEGITWDEYVELEPVTAREVLSALSTLQRADLIPRPESLSGETYKIRWEPNGGAAYYIAINDIRDMDGRLRPYEIFINSKDVNHYSYMVALSRMISAIFRRGGDVSFVVEEMKAVFDPVGGTWIDGEFVPSLMAAIGTIIERHIISRQGLSASDVAASSSASKSIARTDEALPSHSHPHSHPHPHPHPRAAITVVETKIRTQTQNQDVMKDVCPKCYQAAMIFTEGCKVCQNCMYSTCN